MNVDRHEIENARIGSELVLSLSTVRAVMSSDQVVVLYYEEERGQYNRQMTAATDDSPEKGERARARD